MYICINGTVLHQMPVFSLFSLYPTCVGCLLFNISGLASEELDYFLGWCATVRYSLFLSLDPPESFTQIKCRDSFKKFSPLISKLNRITSVFFGLTHFLINIVFVNVNLWHNSKLFPQNILKYLSLSFVNSLVHL